MFNLGLAKEFQNKMPTLLTYYCFRVYLDSEDVSKDLEDVSKLAQYASDTTLTKEEHYGIQYLSEEQ